MVRERSQFVPRCDCRSVSAKRVRRVVVQTELGRVAVDADELCFHGSRPSLGVSTAWTAERRAFGCACRSRACAPRHERGREHPTTLFQLAYLNLKRPTKTDGRGHPRHRAGIERSGGSPRRLYWRGGFLITPSIQACRGRR